MIDCRVASERSITLGRRDGFPLSQPPISPNRAAAHRGLADYQPLDDAAIVRLRLAAYPRARPAARCLLRAARKLDREPESNQLLARVSRGPCLLPRR